MSNDLEKRSVDAVALANAIQKTIPSGSDGATVLLALSILIGAGLNYGPAKGRDDAMEACFEAVRSIVDGDTDLKFSVGEH